jgi:hypothetical protein
LKTATAATSSPGMGGGGMPGAKPPPTYSGANPMPTSFNIVGAFKHAIDLVRGPASVMNAYRDTDSTVNSIMIHYVAILAAIPFVAGLIGGLWYYGIFGYLGFALGGAIYGYVITSAILGYILDLVAVFVVAFITWKLAPNFGTNTTQVKALKLTAYAFTPYFLASILNIIPFIGFLSILGLLYGLYVLYLGIPIILGTPQDKVITYLIVIVVAVFIVYAIIYAIAFGAVALAFFHSFVV